MDVDLDQLKKPCVCGREHSTSAEKILIEAGAVGVLADILENFQNPVLICDGDTRTAAEPFLEEEFKDYPVIELASDRLRDDDGDLEKVMRQLDDCDRGLNSVPVDVLAAIGGGTIHDLTRRAAVEYDIPFVSIPTAACTDSFASCWIFERGEEGARIVPGKGPRWILADLDILSKAPMRLTLAGISGLFEKYISILDWRIAHILSGEYICSEICGDMERIIRAVEREREDIREGDMGALEKLTHALIMVGLYSEMAHSPRLYAGTVSLLNESLRQNFDDMLFGETAGIAFESAVRVYKDFGEAIRSERVDAADVWIDTAGCKSEIPPGEKADISGGSAKKKLSEIEALIHDLPDAETFLRRMHLVGCGGEDAQPGVCANNIGGMSEYLKNIFDDLPKYIRDPGDESAVLKWHYETACKMHGGVTR